MPRWSPGSFWLLAVGYCLTALALDWLSNIGLYRGLGVTPWTPVSGLAIAFAYIFGARGALPIAAAEFLTLAITNKAGFSLNVTMLLTIATTAVWMVGGYILRAMPEFEPRLGSVQSLMRLISVAVAQSIVSSLLYFAALWVSDLIAQSALFPIIWRLLVGHVVGILVVAPLPLMIHAGWRLPRVTPLRLLQIVVLLAALWIIFTYRAATTYQLFYLLFLPLLWIALSDGIGGAALMLNLAQVGIILGAQMRTDIIPSTGSLQVLMISLALTGLFVGAVVTDRHAAGQRLRDQHAALSRALRLRSAGETAAAISHQINQPITAISTYAAVARDALDKGNLELARTTLAKLSAECDRAATVTKSIRDLVKQGSLSSAPTRIQDVVENTRRTHLPELTSLDITLEVDISPQLPQINADQIQLEQALDNIVTNSIEAIRDAGRGNRIKISAAVEKAEIVIEIEDNGPGFAPGLDALATTPFMTTKHNGSGLGLAIARSVAEAHGGSLAILPRNSGACIRLRLPTSGKAR